MSERDVIYCLQSDGAAVLDWPVERIMTAPAITVDARRAEILAALSLMTRRRIRHLPVVEGERADRPRLDRRPGQVPDGQDRGRSRGDARLYPERLRQPRRRRAAGSGRAPPRRSAARRRTAGRHRPRAPNADEQRQPRRRRRVGGSSAVERRPRRRAIAADGGEAGRDRAEQARARLTPITGSDSSTVTREQQRPCRRARPRRGPSAPHWMPTRKAAGISTAPTSAGPHRDARPAERVGRGREQDLQGHQRHRQREDRDERRPSRSISAPSTVAHQRLGGHRQPEIEGQGDQHDQPHRLQEGGLRSCPAAPGSANKRRRRPRSAAARTWRRGSGSGTGRSCRCRAVRRRERGRR